MVLEFERECNGNVAAVDAYCEQARRVMADRGWVPAKSMVIPLNHPDDSKLVLALVHSGVPDDLQDGDYIYFQYDEHDKLQEMMPLLSLVPGYVGVYQYQGHGEKAKTSSIIRHNGPVWGD